MFCVAQYNWCVRELARGKLSMAQVRWSMVRQVLRASGHRVFLDPTPGLESAKSALAGVPAGMFAAVNCTCCDSGGGGGGVDRCCPCGYAVIVAVELLALGRDLSWRAASFVATGALGSVCRSFPPGGAGSSASPFGVSGWNSFFSALSNIRKLRERVQDASEVRTWCNLGLTATSLLAASHAMNRLGSASPPSLFPPLLSGVVVTIGNDKTDAVSETTAEAHAFHR